MGEVVLEQLDIRDILDGQSRIAPTHYNVSARSQAGRLINIKIPDTVKERVKWHHYLSALIGLVNMRISQTNFGKRLIFATPVPLLKIYLYIKKGLETLR